VRALVCVKWLVCSRTQEQESREVLASYYGGAAAAAAGAMSGGGGDRESRWPELAALRRALMARDAGVAAGRELRQQQQQQPGRRAGREDNGKTAKVMHLLLWGPK